MESYQTEEEQLEALRRWWKENGRSTVIMVVLALGVGFGWQGWKQHDKGQSEAASEAYQRMLQVLGDQELSAVGQAAGAELAEQIKTDYSGSSYAQFAALHLARLAVEGNRLREAETQLRWVLGRADSGSDIARVAQLRLARVLAAAGDTDQALTILDQPGGPYQASYAMARGDILLGLDRPEEALQAYEAARRLAGGEGSPANLATLEQKVQALNPVPPRFGHGQSMAPAGADTDPGVSPLTAGEEG